MIIWSFACLYIEKLKNVSRRKRVVRELFFLLGISDPLPLFLKMTVLFIFF